jgi:hypothetical protein
MFVNQPTAYHVDATDDVKRHFWMTPPNTPYTLDVDSLVHLASLYNEYLLDFADENALMSCDLARRIAPSLEHFFDDCHFNVNGARAVAAQMNECLSLD